VASTSKIIELIMKMKRNVDGILLLFSINISEIEIGKYQRISNFGRGKWQRISNDFGGTI
jgi:hypothetical protein